MSRSLHRRLQPQHSNTPVPFDSSQPRARQPLPYHQPARDDLGRCSLQCPSCDALHWQDEEATDAAYKRRLGYPSLFHYCCNFGTADLQPFPAPPLLLQDLYSNSKPECNLKLTVDHPYSRHFLANIRKYNNSLTFTSLSAVQRQLPSAGLYRAGPPSFTICGELRHSIGSLLPVDDQPKFLQVYVCDTTAAGRAAAFSSTAARHDYAIKEDLLQALLVMMQCNPYAQLFTHAHDLIKEQQLVQHCTLRLVNPWQATSREFNLPTAHEVGMIVCGTSNSTNAPSTRDIIVHLRGGGFQRIREVDPVYLPLHYVLILPWGTQGWTEGIPYGPLHGWTYGVAEGARRQASGLVGESTCRDTNADGSKPVTKRLAQLPLALPTFTALSFPSPAPCW